LLHIAVERVACAYDTFLHCAFRGEQLHSLWSTFGAGSLLGPWRRLSATAVAPSPWPLGCGSARGAASLCLAASSRRVRGLAGPCSVVRVRASVLLCVCVQRCCLSAELRGPALSCHLHCIADRGFDRDHSLPFAAGPVDIPTACGDPCRNHFGKIFASRGNCIQQLLVEVFQSEGQVEGHYEGAQARALADTVGIRNYLHGVFAGLLILFPSASPHIL
jgi:hypothetical protein